MRNKDVKKTQVLVNNNEAHSIENLEMVKREKWRSYICCAFTAQYSYYEIPDKNKPKNKKKTKDQI